MNLTCNYCGILFQIRKGNYNQQIKRNPNAKFNCSYKCAYNSMQNRSVLKCKHCNKQFEKHPSQLKKSINHFCTQSCSATYNNLHKTKGTRISKLEMWLKERLTEKYPNLEIHYNRKDAVNAELDIYIPSLKLAFELNGIYHYEPIHGPELLSRMQNNDQRKFQACLERGIELCVIDTSKQKYFKPTTSQQFLIIIQNIISLN